MKNEEKITQTGMKILIIGINAKYSHTSLAVYSISAFLKSKNIENTALEYTINDSYHSIFYDIVKQKPNVIGFSTYIWNISIVKRLISDIKKALPNVKIILGGPEAGYSDEKFIGVDKIIASDGETEFFNYLTDSNDKIEFENLPFPYPASLGTGKTAYYESSRGCPYKCSYCISSIEKNLRFKRLETVKKDISFFIDNGFKKVKFIDRTFNINQNAYEIFEFIIANDNGNIGFHFEIKAELFSDKDIELLSKARKGLIQLEIGLQSLNPDTLLAINRQNDIEKAFSNIKKLTKNDNMRIHLDLIAGLPHEDLSSFISGFNTVYKELNAHILQLGFLKILNGTKIKEEASSHDIKYSSHPPYQVISTKYLSIFDIIELQTCEVGLDAISNKGFFRNSLKFLFENNNISPYDLFKMCGAQIEKKPPLSMPDLFSLFYNIYCGNDFYDKDSLKKHLISDFKIKNPTKSLNL